MKTMNKRTFKRVFSLMLALIMAVGIFGITPVTANAAESRAVIQRYYPSTGSASGTVSGSATFSYQIDVPQSIFIVPEYEISYFFDANTVNCDGELIVTGPNDYCASYVLYRQNVNPAYYRFSLDDSGTYTFTVRRDDDSSAAFFYSIIFSRVK